MGRHQHDESNGGGGGQRIYGQIGIYSFCKWRSLEYAELGDISRLRRFRGHYAGIGCQWRYCRDLRRDVGNYGRYHIADERFSSAVPRTI